jgi:hypothetical protein
MKPKHKRKTCIFATRFTATEARLIERVVKVSGERRANWMREVILFVANRWPDGAILK